MQFSKEIIDETIEYLKTKYNDEKINNIINILSSYDNSKIDNLIISNTLFMYTTPIIKEIFNNEKYTTKTITSFRHEPRILINEFIDNFSKFIDIKELFNQKLVIELLKDTQLFQRMSCIDIIMENINEDNRNKLIDNYINEKKELEFYQIASLADICFLYAYNHISDDNRKKIKETFIKSYYSKLSEYGERIMFNEVKSDLINLSISDKSRFLKNLESGELKQEVFKFFEFDKHIDLVINQYDFDITKYISEDILFEKFKSLVAINQYEKYLKVLSVEKQCEAVMILEENKIPFLVYSACLKIGTLKYIFEIEPNLLNDFKLYELYKEYEDIKYLVRIKEIYLKSNEFYLNILCEDDFVNLLTEDEKNYFINIIKDTTKDKGRFKDVQNIKKYNNTLYKHYVQGSLEYLQNNPNERAFVTIESLFKLYDVEEQLVIIRHLKLIDILSFAIDSQTYFDNLMKLLKIDENLLRNFPSFENNDVMFYYYSEERNERINTLLKYLDKKDYGLIISKDVIENNEYLKNYYIETVDSNPSMVTSFALFNMLPLEKKKKLLEIIDIRYLKDFTCDAFFKLDKNEDNKKILMDALYNRFDEYVKYYDEINSMIHMSKDKILYSVFDEEHKKLFIEKTKIINTLIDILILTNDNNDLVVDRILKLYDDSNIKYYSSNSINFNKRIIFKNLPDNIKNYIINKMNFNSLLYSFTYCNDKNILNLLLKKIHEDSSCLIDESVIRNIDVLFFFVDDNEKEYIKNSIIEKLRNNKLYASIFNDKVKSLSLTDGINYLDIYKKGFIESDQELFLKLLENNPFLLKSIRTIIFNPNVKNLNMEFIEKLSRYRDLQEKLELISFDNNKMILFNKIAKYLEENVDNKVVFDTEISKVIEYLAMKNSFKDIENVDLINIPDILNFILCDYSKCAQYRYSKKYETINEMCDLGFDNYIENKKNKCDELFENTKEIDQIKNIYFNKYFSLSLEQVNNFYKTYIMNYDKVTKYASNDLPVAFINLLTKIIHIDDINTLKELYLSNDIYFDLTDVYEIEAIMKHAYSVALVNDYKNKQNGTIIKKNIKDLDGNVEEYEMMKLVDDFGIIVHSTCAYGEMPIRDDDYYSSWNYNPNTENHGICCSYITNSSYGTAAVTGNGVMLGFTNITPETVAAFSPYDLATSNTGFNIKCYYTPYCTVLDEIDDYTRHTHNEFNLERRINDGSNYCLQPDCIIILEDMDDKIKANSIKAYNDFKKHNPNTKLVYIDRVKLAKKEAAKLDIMIKEYLDNKDLSLLANILNKYESNLCCSDFLSIGVQKSKKLYDMNELFKTDIITKLLFDTLDEITMSKDKEKLMNFIYIMDHEQFKFDLIDDKNADRKHVFKLYSFDLKKKINTSLEMLNINEKESTK